jgi:DNA-binding GntR family transcriptional regulator
MTTNRAGDRLDPRDDDPTGVDGARPAGAGTARAGRRLKATGGADVANADPIGVRHRPLRHAVRDEVRRRIVAGHYAQGERLFEDQIATELGVSRNPVREALQALAQEGFIELLPRRGARVALVPASRAAELFEVREALEGLVARLAATRRQAAHIELLRDVVRRGRDAAASGELNDLPALNTEFHRALCDAAGNELLTTTIERLADVIEWVYSKRIALRGARSWEEHGEIVEAVAAAEPERAETAACRHIANARAAYVDTMLDGAPLAPPVLDPA